MVFQTCPGLRTKTELYVKPSYIVVRHSCGTDNVEHCHLNVIMDACYLVAHLIIKGVQQAGLVRRELS